MANFTYLAYNILVAGSVLLTAYYGGMLTKGFLKRVMRGYLFVSLPFILWDIWAAYYGHWGFNTRYIIDGAPEFFGIPFEEVLFFFTVPLAMLFVWEAITKHVGESFSKRRLMYARIVTVVIAMAGVVLLFLHSNKGYTVSVALSTIVTSILLLRSSLISSRRYMIFQLVHFSLFFVFNTFLTALPVITYGENSYMNFRIGTIPLEDFLFSYSLISLFILVSRERGNDHNKLTA